ncbi:MAG: antibiotic biosynthesis monooxygenase [Acidobacteria bacterium]|nr:antibiotic biosynthesis monooxygenase [Acidobacteriota bacterium]
MIARIWHGKTNANHATAYLGYLFQSGIPAYRATSGSKGAWVLRPLEGNMAHSLRFPFWDSREAIAAFTGSDPAIPRYYAEDEKYLLVATMPNGRPVRNGMSPQKLCVTAVESC